MKNKLILIGIGAVLLTILLSFQSTESQQWINEFLEEDSTLHSSKYDLDDNKFKVVMSSDVINYRDDTGNLRPVELIIEPSQDTQYAYQGTKSVYKSYFKQTPDTGDTVKILSKGHELFMQPHSINYRNQTGHTDQVSTTLDSNAQARGNEVTYPEAFGPGINIKYEFLNSRLKQTLEINNKSDIRDPADYLYPPGYADMPVCFKHNITLDIDFIFRPDNNINIIINNQTWDKQTQQETENEIIFRDNLTGEIIYIFEKPMAFGTNDTKLGRYVIKKQGDQLYIIHKTDWNWARRPELYTIRIDPTTSLNYDLRLLYFKVTSCQRTGDCCEPEEPGVPQVGDCIVSNPCVQAGVLSGLTKFDSTGCDCNNCVLETCSNPFNCCGSKTTNTAGHYHYYRFNLSQGITDPFEDVIINESNFSLSLTSPNTGSRIEVLHTNDNSSACTVNHTIDSFPQPPEQWANTSLNFTVTNHTQAVVSLGNSLIWFYVHAKDNTDSSKNRVPMQS